MRTKRVILCILLLCLTTAIGPLASTVAARSVHNTYDVDMLPQGTLVDASEWTTGSETSFTQEDATYTEAMVADQRLTMAHHRPVHLDTMSVWAGTSPTDSNYSIGAPDGASTWSTGPEIKLTNFDVSGLTDYALVEVHMKAVIQIPDALTEDTVRISLQHSGGYELLKTFAHTQGNLDYINNSAYSVNLTGLLEWTWQDLNSLEFTLDYVSAGGVDDSRLVVDAVGLDITVQTPWYGGEVGLASTEFTGHSMPLVGLDLSQGESVNMALTDCGLTPSIAGTTGEWVSDIIENPPEQQLGRVHLQLSEGEADNVSLEYAVSGDGESFSSFTALPENTLLPLGEAYKIKVTAIDSCIESVWADVNDPSLTVSGRVFGTNDGIDPTYSRWLVFVNDELVSNEPMTLGTFAHSWPIGQFMVPGATSYTVEVKAWFTWDSLGDASHTALEISSLSVNGGYAIEWDEDPVCEAIGDQELTEDGGGAILPLLLRCSDDRTSNENLLVEFTNSNEALVEVDLTEGEIRLKLMPEANGQSVVGVKVIDEAGNMWSQSFNLLVNAVDDAPDLGEFQSLVPAERDEVTVVNLTVSDRDSTTLTASTNRSWATVDLSNGTVTVQPPNAGFFGVLVSVCDQTSCSERILDLDVMALADLLVESIDFDSDEMTQGDIVSMRVMVRNQGQAEATFISVRCQNDQQLMSVEIIPVLAPGELGSVTCDWQIPEDAKVIRFSAVVDRGLEIPEGDESNNIMEKLVGIDEKQVADKTSSDSGLSSTTVWTGSIGLLLAVIALFAYLTPAKIKKIE
ncbi:MAG: CARDB domain-containing protein [Candidatus Poseidonia sp.]|uniref:CARDB domain-containing protein n=1 Tax=Poseidonia sp. TaxID=2666344 RepID=UPI0030BC5E4C|nr:CARDB domain-containing protein [Poseidonia sp.]